MNGHGMWARERREGRMIYLSSEDRGKAGRDKHYEGEMMRDKDEGGTGLV